MGIYSEGSPKLKAEALRIRFLTLLRYEDFPWPYLGVSQDQGYLCGGPHNKDNSIVGPSILGPPHFGKVPHVQGFDLYV